MQPAGRCPTASRICRAPLRVGWCRTRREQRVHFGYDRLGAATQGFVEDYLRAPPRAAIEQRAVRHQHAQHFLEAQGLRAKLDTVLIANFGPPALVFDREWLLRAAALRGVKLDDVSLTGKTEAQGAKRNAISPPHRSPRLGATAIHPLVLDPPLRRPCVLDPDPFEVNQRALPRTDDKMLERRDRDQLGFSVGQIIAPPFSMKSRSLRIPAM